MTKTTDQIDFIEFPAQSVDALAQAKSFYTEAFGWVFKDWGDDYADTTSSGVSCGFNADPQHRPGSPLVVIYVSDLQQAYDKIKAAGGRITRDIFSFPGGRRFHFKDPGGNELAVWTDQ
jgi:predicted enzyme related to lactoylglutathione lyase